VTFGVWDSSDNPLVFKTLDSAVKEKILALYACGMSQQDFSEQVKKLYDVGISLELVSKISEKVMPEVMAWQNRVLEAVYLHQIRSSTCFASYKDIKPLIADLKKVYTAITEDERLENLMEFKEKWGKQCHSCVISWEENWNILSTFFAYPTWSLFKILKMLYALERQIYAGILVFGKKI